MTTANKAVQSTLLRDMAVALYDSPLSSVFSALTRIMEFHKPVPTRFPASVKFALDHPVQPALHGLLTLVLLIHKATKARIYLLPIKHMKRSAAWSIECIQRRLAMDVVAGELMSCHRPGIENELQRAVEFFGDGFGPKGEANGFFHAYKKNMIMWYVDCPGRYSRDEHTLNDMYLNREPGDKMGFGPGFKPIPEDVAYSNQHNLDPPNFLQHGREEYMVGMLQRLLLLHTPQGNPYKVPPLNVPGVDPPYELKIRRTILPQNRQPERAGPKANGQAEQEEEGQAELEEFEPAKILMVTGADHAVSFRHKWEQYEGQDRAVPDERMEHLLKVAGGYDAWYVRDMNFNSERECRVPPGAVFTKTWEFRNPYTMPWPEGTNLMFVQGDYELCRRHDNWPVHTLAGYREHAQVSVQLTAPTKPGQYVAEFQLATKTFQRFGTPVWLRILADPTAQAIPEQKVPRRPVPRDWVLF